VFEGKARAITENRSPAAEEHFEEALSRVTDRVLKWLSPEASE